MTQATSMKTGSLSPWASVQASGALTPDEEMQQMLAGLQAGAQPSDQSQEVSQMNQQPMQAAGPVVQAPSRAPAGLLDDAGARLQNFFTGNKVPEPAKGPVGTKNTNTAKMDSTNKVVGVKNLSYTPEEYSDMLSAAASNPAIREQQRGVDHLQELLGLQSSQPLQTDLTPLLQLADSLTKGKTNYAAGYSKPEDGVARNKTILDSAMELQKRKGDISKSVLEGVKSLKAGSNTQQLLEQIAASQIAGWQPPDPRTHTGNPATNSARYLTTFQNNPTVKPYTEAINASRDLLASAGKADWLNDKTLVTKLVSAAHLAPVSDTDIRQFSGDPSLVANFNRLIQRLDKGENLNPEDRTIITQYANLTAKKNQAVVAQLADDYAKTQGPEYGYDSVKSRNMLNPAVVTVDTGSKKAGPKRTKSLDQMSQAELDAYEKQLKGGH